MATIIQSITELPVGEIAMIKRLRPVSQAGVEALKASIAELGVMKDPIHVRKIKRSGQIVLMAGGHRLSVAKELGWDTIKVTCWECNDDFARLMEIDDNLAGAELTVLDTAVFLAERKRVYEKMYPEARATSGAELVAKRWDTTDTMSAVSFAKVTAEKFGISDRHVRRMVKAGSDLSGDDANALRASERAVTLSDLSELAKIGEVDERARVVALLAEGGVKSAKDARKAFANEQGRGPAPLNNTDKTWLRLKDAWNRAPKAGRIIFLEECGDEVAALLAELEANRDDG